MQEYIHIILFTAETSLLIHSDRKCYLSVPLYDVERETAKTLLECLESNILRKISTSSRTHVEITVKQKSDVKSNNGLCHYLK